MPYDPAFPKISQYEWLKKTANTPQAPCEDISFLNRILSLRYLGIFYGTDVDGIRNGYASSFLDALKSRIGEPITEVWQQRHACFFKPYSSVCQGFVGALDGLTLPVFATLSVLGIFGSNPYILIGFAAISSMVELISGFVSLGQSLYHTIKSKSNQTSEQREKAGVYFQDAVIRLALVIPLVAVSLVAVPAEFIRFFTRCIGTLLHLMRRDTVASDRSRDERAQLLQDNTSLASSNFSL